MNAPYKHRRTYNPSTAFPTLNPGEIAINGANRQLAVGDTSGTPLDLLGVRLFDARAIYFEDDLIAHEGQVLRAIATLSPGAFDPADWESTGGGGTAADIVNVPAGNIAATDVQAALNELDAEKAPVVHTHTIAQVTGLQPALDAKADDADLAGKANVVHTHAITDVTGLQTALDGKADDADLTFKVEKGGDTMEGFLTLFYDPIDPLHAATKQYVDALVGGGGSASILVSDTPPVGAPDNALWWESDSGKMYIYYNDGDSTQWVQVSPAPPAGAAIDARSVPKAWINFNGTGTIAIRQSFGVSGLVDDGQGQYKVTFTTAFLNTNYAVTMSVSDTGSSAIQAQSAPQSGTLKTTTFCRLYGFAASGATFFDCSEMQADFFGDQAASVALLAPPIEDRVAADWRLVFNNAETRGISIFQPDASFGGTPQAAAALYVPAGEAFYVEDASIVPVVRTFRDAWAYDQPAHDIYVDMAKAKGIAQSRLRVWRAPLLVQLDGAYLRADETNDIPGKQQVVRRKQRLREITDDPRIVNATTPEALSDALDEIVSEPW